MILRIGDVARELDITIPTVRYWSDIFPMPVRRTRGGQRLYPREAVNRLRLVKQLLYVERYTINGATQQYLNLIRGTW